MQNSKFKIKDSTLFKFFLCVYPSPVGDAARTRTSCPNGHATRRTNAPWREMIVYENEPRRDVRAASLPTGEGHEANSLREF